MFMNSENCMSGGDLGLLNLPFLNCKFSSHSHHTNNYYHNDEENSYQINVWKLMYLLR